MKFFFSDLFERKQTTHQDKHTAVAVQESLHNITDGSEFFDDAIRMKEQPFMYTYTEESVAAGSPKDLWR
jgi:hypothetical protein